MKTEMTDAKNVLRGLIVLAVVLFFIGWRGGVADFGQMSAADRAYLIKIFKQSPILDEVAVAFVALYFVALAGLFFWQRWARYLFAVLFVRDTFNAFWYFSPGQVMQVKTAWGGVPEYWIDLTNGAILACVFLPSARALFARNDKQTKIIGSANQQGELR